MNGVKAPTPFPGAGHHSQVSLRCKDPRPESVTAAMRDSADPRAAVLKLSSGSGFVGSAPRSR